MDKTATRQKSATADNKQKLSPGRRLAGLTALSFLMSCASVSDVAKDYRGAIAAKSGDRPGSETSIVFLVDGLSVGRLETAIISKDVPSIATFFAAPDGNLRSKRSSWFSVFRSPPLFLRGRASFPTLTYPNLVSVLTGMPVASHGILGNRVIQEGQEVVNLENVFSWKTLDSRIGDKTVFSQMHARGLASVSFSYPFPYASTAKQQANLDAALDYASKDYIAVDTATLASATELLKSTPPPDWPRFIFIHLIAVDAYSHEFGPDAPEVKDALKTLDLELSKIFLQILDGEASGRRIDVVLTADHGFAPVTEEIPLAEIGEHLRRDVQIVPDNRMAGVYLPQSWSPKLKAETAESFLQIKNIAWSAVHVENTIEIFFKDGKHARIDLAPFVCQSGAWEARFSWLGAKRNDDDVFHCPEDFDASGAAGDPRYLVPPLVEYFTSPLAPDIVLTAEVGAEFTGSYKGNHGGLSPSEAFVPILTRHIDLGEDVFPTHRLLHLLNLLP